MLKIREILGGILFNEQLDVARPISEFGKDQATLSPQTHNTAAHLDVCRRMLFRLEVLIFQNYVRYRLHPGKPIGNRPAQPLGVNPTVIALVISVVVTHHNSFTV